MTAPEHVRKILASSTFHSSESLQKLLTYLAEHSLGDPPQPVKEYQIATEVLGRGPKFDPRMDSSVRVNIARLRSKLLEYYSTEGKDDPWRIEIPKGSYITQFHDSALADATSGARELPAEVTGGVPPTRRRVTRPLRYGALAAALVVGLALGALVTGWFGQITSSNGRRSNAALREFWNPFTARQDKTVVVFSNARFVGDGKTGLRYYNPEIDRLEDVRELHTGVGEVAGVYELSRLFQSLGSAFEVKRAALVDWDEVKKANVIFIGGPAENMPVRELRRGARFVFESQNGPDGKPRMVLADRHAGGKQSQCFDAGSATPIRRDYAVIRWVPGLVPGRQILILAGITTLGTQAAVEFVCRPDTVQALLSQLGRDTSEQTAGFETVLEVSINGGVPVDSKVVAFHEISAGAAVVGGVE